MSLGATLAPSVKDDRLSLLIDLGAMLHREVGLDDLLREMGSRIARALSAERATVFAGEIRHAIVWIHVGEGILESDSERHP